MEYERLEPSTIGMKGVSCSLLGRVIFIALYIDRISGNILTIDNDSFSVLLNLMRRHRVDDKYLSLLFKLLREDCFRV